MDTRPPMNACPVCGSTVMPPRIQAPDRLHGTASVFAVAECAACGAGVTLPPVTVEELAAFYPQGYGPYARHRNPLAVLISTMIRAWQGMLARRSQPLAALRSLAHGPGPHSPGARASASGGQVGRGLDVGAGRGDLAAMLQAHGWRMLALEPSEAAVSAAKSRGIDARCGVLSTVELEPNHYDFAVFQHSLEHTLDPVADLSRVCGTLRPGGLVLIGVPNFGCIQRRWLGGNWFHLDLPRHRVHFTADSLRLALERAGFAVERIGSSTTSVGLPASLQYAIAGRCLFPEGIALQLSTGLCALSLPFAWLLNRATGQGDALYAVARKPEGDRE